MSAPRGRVDLKALKARRKGADTVIPSADYFVESVLLAVQHFGLGLEPV